ncbi:MAG: hypothetical protein B6245_05840 [Desulfobacteraceae bacterium 4572_88]|nr:MAG: hypothetical protein B6245_05840 [Desulfobacteraceae bacterium 4572_88]
MNTNTILIIDDEQSVRMSIAAYLEDHEFKVIKAENGRIGLDIFRSRSPDLVLVDPRMPEVGGLDVLSAITRESPETPTIAISGADVISDAVEALHLGAWDYILKPIRDMSVLIHALERSLERARLIRENRLCQHHLEDEVASQTKELNREIAIRKQTEKELARSERKLDSIVRSVPDIIYRLDPGGRFSFVSDTVRKYGYEPEELIGESVFEIVHPDDRDAAQYRINERRTGDRRTRTLEIRLLGKNKASVPFELRVKGIQMNHVFLVEAEGLYDSRNPRADTFLGTQGIARDISLRKQARDRLAEINKCLLNFGSDFRTNIRCLTQTCGRLVRADCAIYNRLNNGMLCAVGHWNLPSDYEIETSPNGHLCYDVIRNEEKDVIVIRNLEQSAYARTDPNVSLYNMKTYASTSVRCRSRAVGSMCVVYQQDVDLSENDKGVIQMIATAIGREEERMRAEAEFRRLATAIEQVAECVIITDPEGVIQYVNPVFVKMTGYERYEAIGKNAHLLKSGEHPPEYFDEMWDIIRNRKMWRGRFVNKKKDGTLYHSEATISPVFDEAGEIVSFVSLQRDISKVVRQEALIRQAQKMEALGTLASGISHDFNNILSAIMGNTELLLLRMPETIPGREKLVSIQKASHRAKDLVRQILAFSRKAEQKPVHIQLIVREALKLLTASLPSLIEIREQITSEPCMVMADPTQIHQVMMNLCTNAHHAMREKGGVIEVSLSLTDVNAVKPSVPPVPEPGLWVCLSVRDTGHGIPPATLEKIFDPYFTTKKKGVGTGLGLAVVHGIIQSHGGSISVDSEMGKGTVFHVFLPGIRGVAPPEIRSPESESLPTATHERILLVDDEEMLLDLGRDTLEDMGYEVVTQSRPENALKIFQEDPNAFDLVITDMTMPRMTGDVLAGEMMRIRPDIPVILCTGFSELTNQEKANAMGIRGFLMKPYDIRELIKTIQNALIKEKA